MRVLVVENEEELGRLWAASLRRQGMNVDLISDADAVFDALRQTEYDIMVLDLMLPQGQALAIADYASYRRPEARIIFVTNSTFFSDGSIFNLSTNACAYVQTATPPEDLVAMVEHYGKAS